VFVITSSRSDYGFLRDVSRYLVKKVKFKLVITGSHLVKKFGYTYNEITNDGFMKKNFYKINLNIEGKSDKLIPKIICKFNKFFKKTKPDFVVLAGDRYEIFSIALSAFLNNIKIIHIGGGESTLGSVDDTYRHLITRLSFIHLVSHDLFYKNLLSLGIKKKNIFKVGNLSLLNFLKSNLLNKKKIKRLIGIDFKKKLVNVSIHPDSILMKNEKKKDLILNVLSCLKKIKDINIIFTCPNFDDDYQIIIKEIEKFVQINKNAYFYKSLGNRLYLSILYYSHVLVGNSSSGVYESPYLNTHSLLIGNRQKGRPIVKNVFEVKNDKKKILKMIIKILSFKKKYIKLKKNIKINKYKSILKAINKAK
jgi:GDP/UDP-N,N'-diacetylbacillosamine 2-epimerase (hydrolysing)